MISTEYVRLTFKPAGASRKRTVWAIRLSAVVFKVCDIEGNDSKEVRPGVDRSEIVVISPVEDVRILPARMNNHYAQLEVLP